MTAELARVVGVLADLVTEQARTPTGPDAEQALAPVTRLAVEIVPGAQWAAVTLLAGNRTPTTAAATDPRVNPVDDAQYGCGQGPCLSALWESPVVLCPDVRTDGRWPLWSARVAHLDVRSMLSLHVQPAVGDGASLNLYSPATAAFDVLSESLGRLCAAHAALALRASRESEELRMAIDSRDLIGQAKGIIMERFGLGSAEEAFELMVRASQTGHLKLRDVAARVVSRGDTDLPVARPPRRPPAGQRKTPRPRRPDSPPAG